MTALGYDLRVIAAEIEPRYGDLRQAAEMYFDHQKTRVATANRIGSLTVDISRYEPYAKGMAALEDELSGELVRLYRMIVPEGIRAWQDATRGIGEHTLARFLGHLGHPRLATPKYWARNSTIGDDEFGDAENPKRMLVDGEPFLRSLSQLRQFCGHGRADRRREGMEEAEALALGRPDCKMVLHLIAVSVVKQQVRNTDVGKIAIGPLGQLYLDTKAKYAERTHTGPCPGGYTDAGDKVVFSKCKLAGHYAVAGDPFARSHVNAIGLRHLGKQILEELYGAAWEEWC